VLRGHASVTGDGSAIRGNRRHASCTHVLRTATRREASSHANHQYCACRGYSGRLILLLRLRARRLKRSVTRILVGNPVRSNPRGVVCVQMGRGLNATSRFRCRPTTGAGVPGMRSASARAAGVCCCQRHSRPLDASLQLAHWRLRQVVSSAGACPPPVSTPSGRGTSPRATLRRLLIYGLRVRCTVFTRAAGNLAESVPGHVEYHVSRSTGSPSPRTCGNSTTST